MKLLTGEELIVLVNQTKTFMEACPDWRTGQSLFNALANIRSDLAESIRGTEYDMFYKNGEVEELTKKLLQDLAEIHRKS